MTTIKDIKTMSEQRYIISVSTIHPLAVKDTIDLTKEYILELDLYSNSWDKTPLLSEAMTFTLKEVSQAIAILNKISRCFYQIVPTFEMQIFESKLNTFPDEEL